VVTVTRTVVDVLPTGKGARCSIRDSISFMCVGCCLSDVRRDPSSRYPVHLAYLSALRPVSCAGFPYPYLLHHSTNNMDAKLTQLKD